MGTVTSSLLVGALDSLAKVHGRHVAANGATATDIGILLSHKSLLNSQRYIRIDAEAYSSIRTSNTIYFASEAIVEDPLDLFDLFDLFEVQPEGSRLWRGAVNGRETASSKLAELSAKSGKPVFAMNLQTREILEFTYPDKQAPQSAEW